MASLIINYTAEDNGYQVPLSSPNPITDPVKAGSISSVLVFGVMTFIVIGAIIMGNALVCIAVATDRNLKTHVQHRFLVSLAVADLMVGVLIMPLGLVNQVLGYWVFGAFLCDIWKAVDVLVCTASIWNLCFIAIDRYYSITEAVRYNAWRTPRLVNLMILFVWTLSTLISIPPLFGWNAKGSPTGRFKCLISNDVGYILFSTSGSFYIPAIIMIIVYLKVWRAASSRARSNQSPQATNQKQKTQATSVDGHQSPELAVRTALAAQTMVVTLQDIHFPNGLQSSYRDTRILKSDTVQQAKQKLANKREKRTTLVLGIIMGTFLACWYPFFQLYVISALCGVACNIPTLLFDIIFWMGYCNSALNPVIYTVFNRDFRRAFSRILDSFRKYITCRQ